MFPTDWMGSSDMIPKRVTNNDRRQERVWDFIEAVAALRDEDIEGVTPDEDAREPESVREKY